MALLFPDIKKCIMCNRQIDKLSLPLCEQCTKEITFYKGETVCNNCGRFYHGPTCDAVRIEKIIAVARYTGAWKELIHKFKFNNQKYLAKGLAEKMIERLQDEDMDIDLITYVPATTKTLSQRGYDQSQLLAKELALMLNKPMLATLKKEGNRPPQHTLQLSKRKNDWHGEFKPIKGTNLQNKNILLVDDIYTTGYTIHHALKVLKAQKTKSLITIVLAN
ncbi:ComF family protein [Alkalicella caledoniensis]|uniref:ComF family protein n=1 Tax=Alkalicella caledoniensis TaxID=2731377 RepID=A0A7G9W718_ALKCA|nr:ComF family protein [Alkalicella caledoniensis]QNO14480.1 ComF family protein [Alkalicella caledoniensis]